MRIALLLGGAVLLAAGGAIAWLCHAPAVPQAWRSISPGMSADAAQRVLGAGCVRERTCTRDCLSIEVPGDPLLHGRRRWVVVDLRLPTTLPDDPDDLAAAQVQDLRIEDAYRSEWLYRIPGLDRLL